MESLENQNILITGATDGIGKLTARHLAKLGATVVIHGRDEARCKDTIGEIKSATSNKKVHYYVADFSSLEEVRDLGNRITHDLDKLHILINNAGMGTGKDESLRQESQDGYELVFAVNYLAPFLLTHRLLPLIKKSAPARIVNIASIGQAALNLQDIMQEKGGYSSVTAYGQSKLALIMLTIELASRLENNFVTVNALHPGSLLDTKMVRESNFSVMGSVEEGAESEVFMAADRSLNDVTGKYFDQKHEAKANAQAYDPEVRKGLWTLSEKWVGLTS